MAGNKRLPRLRVDVEEEDPPSYREEEGAFVKDNLAILPHGVVKKDSTKVRTDATALSCDLFWCKKALQLALCASLHSGLRPDRFSRSIRSTWNCMKSWAAERVVTCKEQFMCRRERDLL